MTEALQPVCERRSLFDSVSMNFLSKLENSKEISSVEFHSEKGATTDQIQLWEKENEPYLLPDDFISFYSSFNGVSLHWDVSIGEKNVTVGEIKLNGLNELNQVESCHLASFILNSQADVGDIVLVYNHKSSHDTSGIHPGHSLRTDIWFRDSSLNWYYLCPSFKHLLRLMVTHLGKISLAINHSGTLRHLLRSYGFQKPS